MKSAKAFAPANISCVFKIYPHKNARWAGSIGFGFTLTEGVLVKIEKSDKTEIFFNNKKINFPTVRQIIDTLTTEKVNVNISSPLPLGVGFGLSGASALASAYALNKLLGLKKSKKQLAIIAHTAEVENQTGLGDVINQYFGGFLLKLKPSSSFEVIKLSVKTSPIYCAYFDKLPTHSVLSDKKLTKKINSAADLGLDKIEKLLKSNSEIMLEDIIKISSEFATDCGLLRDNTVSEKIKSIENNNGSASMMMLGNAVFSNINFKGSTALSSSDQRARILT